jgi:hypothetical protein
MRAMPRRLRTEKWTHDEELRFLAVTRLSGPGSPVVPAGARAYTAFGWVLHEVYALVPAPARPATHYMHRAWRLTKARSTMGLRSLP